MHHFAVAVGDHLNFDMARLAEIAFQIDSVIAKGGFGLGAGRAECFGETRLGLGDFHAAATTA